jgi:TonB family protein
VLTLGETATSMRYFLLTLMTLVTAFGADSEAIMKMVTALVRSADQASAADHNSEAEEGYKAAIVQCDLLPPDKYGCKTDVLWKLGRLNEHLRDLSKAEAIYKERLEILLSHQKAGARPDLDVGQALFDLQELLEAGNLTTTEREADALSYMERARSFYAKCKTEYPDMRPVCDFRLANVEGLHGAILLLKRRFDEAAPFLKAVVDRPDWGARKDVLTAALRGYATILISQGKTIEAQEFRQRAQRLDAPPQRRFGAEPAYTESARKSRIEGTVGLEIGIDDFGSVTNVHVVKPLDAGLDENCVHAVQHWTFESGKATQTMKVECHFALLGESQRR